MLIRLGNAISFETSDRVVAALALLRQHLANILEDLTPSYASILMTLKPQSLGVFEARQLIAELLTDTALKSCLTDHAPQLFEIPVLYDTHMGPDLKTVANTTGLSTDDIIQLHCRRSYRVFAIGFAPGFCFLGPLDPILALPRKDSPRLRVPAGSVAIAERQTAVYPCESPGGWHLIGRTPIDLRGLLLNADKPVQIGDELKFVPMSSDQWPGVNQTQ